MYTEQLDIDISTQDLTESASVSKYIFMWLGLQEVRVVMDAFAF